MNKIKKTILLTVSGLLLATGISGAIYAAENGSHTVSGGTHLYIASTDNTGYSANASGPNSTAGVGLNGTTGCSYPLSFVDYTVDRYYTPLNDISNFAISMVDSGAQVNGAASAPLMSTHFYWLPYGTSATKGEYCRLTYAKFFKIPLGSNKHVVTFGSGQNDSYVNVYEVDSQGRLLYDSGFMKIDDATKSYTVQKSNTQYLLLYFKVADGKLDNGTSTDSPIRTIDIWGDRSGTETYFVWKPYTIELDNQDATTAGTPAVYARYKHSISTSDNTTSLSSGTVLKTNSGNTRAITIPTKTGYTFHGYYTGTNGTGTKMIDASGYATASLTTSHNYNTTLYAYWTVNTYTMTIDPNNGTMYNGDNPTTTPFTTKFIYGRKTYIGNVNSNGSYNPANAPTRTGYTFSGFSFTGKGTGGLNTGGEAFYFSDGNGGASSTKSYIFNGNVGGNVTATAQWTINKYTLTVNPNGGTWGGSASSQDFEQNYNSTKTIANPTRTGYTFTGWTLSGSGTLSGTTFTYGAGNTTLTANWKVNSYTLTVNPNGGTWNGSTSAQNFTQNYSTAKAIPNPTRTGYIFGGWTLSGSGTLSGTTFTYGAGNATLTAKWTAITYGIRFNGNKPDGASSNVAGSTSSLSNLKYDTYYNLSANGYSLTGWTFNGWNTKADGTGTSYSNGQSVRNLTTANGGTVTLYAQWKVNTYTIYFNANKPSAASLSVTGSTATMSKINYDTSYDLSANGYNLAGWTFTGWNTKANGTGTSYSNKQSVKNLVAANGGSITLYAQWKSNGVLNLSAVCQNPTAISNSKTIALSATDSGSGIVGYYWGTTNPSTSSVTYTSISRTTAYNSTWGTTKNVSASAPGTYYFAVKDEGGTVKTVSITLYSTGLNSNGTALSPALFPVSGTNYAAYTTINPSGAAITFPTASRTGYYGGTYTRGAGKSDAWSTGNSASSGASTLKVSGNSTYYSVWKVDTVNITLKENKPTGDSTPTDVLTTTYNGGIAMTSSVALAETLYTATYDSSQYLYTSKNTYSNVLAAGSAEGWTLLGWYTEPQAATTYDLTTAESSADKVNHLGIKVFNADGTPDLESGYFVKDANGVTVWKTSAANGDITLYAHWICNKYTVTFDKNANDGYSACVLTNEQGVVTGEIKTAIGNSKAVALFDVGITLPNANDTDVFSLKKTVEEASFQKWSETATEIPTVRHMEEQTLSKLDATANGSVTLYAIYDHFPLIDAKEMVINETRFDSIKDDEDAFEEWFLSHITFTDNEDGVYTVESPNSELTILVEDVGEVIKLLDTFTQIGSVSTIVRVTDSFGNQNYQLVEVWYQPVSSNEEIDAREDVVYTEVSYVRSISERAYNTYYEHDDYSWDTYRNYGGLRPTSVWYNNPVYVEQIQTAFANHKAGIYEYSFKFSFEQILASQIWTEGDRAYDLIVKVYGKEKADAAMEELGDYYIPDGHKFGNDLSDYYDLITSWQE